MKFKKSAIIAAAALFMGLCSMQADAQYRLPSSHSRQHQSMLAMQRPVAGVVKNESAKSIISEIEEREAFQDNDIFATNWDSPLVNAYQGLPIPQTKNLDVASFVAPLKNCRVSSSYGWRPRFGRMHRGTDLTLNVGDTVMSAFDGKVRLVKYEAKGYGHYVVVRHDNGMETVYGHLSRTLVKPNQRVKAGQAIALGGNTGRSTGPHLHFETRFMGLAINPEAIIDFEHKVPHKDIFTFDKTNYERSQSYGPRGKVRAGKAKYGKRSKTLASKSSKKSKSSKRSKSTKKRTKK